MLQLFLLIASFAFVLILSTISIFAATACYLMLPALYANMAPGYANKWNWPGGMPIHEPTLGAGKTWRGLYSAVLFGIVTGVIQTIIHYFGWFHDISLVDYTSIGIWFGLWVGLGAKLGDTIKSFFKRRNGFERGDELYPWDQIDYVLGAGIVVVYFAGFSSLVYVAAYLLIPLFLGRLGSAFAHWRGEKKDKY